MTKEEEQEAVSRAQKGDTVAFEALVLAHQRKVYTQCLRMTGNPEDAEDLAQDAFVRAYKSLAGFKGESGFGSWLYRLTKNICIDFLRREKRREKSSLTYQDETGAVLDIEVPDVRFTPEGLLAQKQTVESVERGLAGLSQEHKQILILRELQGKSYDEIAAELSLTAGTVKSRISRARLMLRKYLLDDGNIPDKSPSKQTKKGGQSRGSM